MYRALTLLTIVAGAFLIGTHTSTSETLNSSQQDLQSLKQQRVQLLEQRVATIKKWVDQEDAAAIELVQPELDVLQAKLDYATTDEERRDLYQSLLAKYDSLIEWAQLNVADPVRSGADVKNALMHAESKLLYLKAERTRIQILHDSLD